MPDNNAARKLFKEAMKSFREENYTSAKEAFYRMGDTDENLPPNCATLSALYYCLTSFAITGDTKNLSDIQDIMYDDADFNALQPVYLRQFMSDFKHIMVSVFDYKNHEGQYDEIISWYNALIGKSLENDKNNLAL